MSNDVSPFGTITDAIQEDHLRLAFLVDRIEDELAAARPVAVLLSRLRQDFDRHALLEEEILEEYLPDHLAEHRRGHDRMRANLATLIEMDGAGKDIRPFLSEVLEVFTHQLFPADEIFRTLASKPL